MPVVACFFHLRRICTSKSGVVRGFFFFACSLPPDVVYVRGNAEMDGGGGGVERRSLRVLSVVEPDVCPSLSRHRSCTQQKNFRFSLGYCSLVALHMKPCVCSMFLPHDIGLAGVYTCARRSRTELTKSTTEKAGQGLLFWRITWPLGARDFDKPYFCVIDFSVVFVDSFTSPLRYFIASFPFFLPFPPLDLPAIWRS